MSLIQQALEKAGKTPLNAPEAAGPVLARSGISDSAAGAITETPRSLNGEIFRKMAQVVLKEETLKIAGLVLAGFIALTILFYLMFFALDFVMVRLPSARRQAALAVQNTQSASPVQAEAVSAFSPPSNQASAGIPAARVLAPPQISSAALPPGALQGPPGVKREPAWIPNFVLTGVTSAGDVPLALINNEIVRVGDRLPEGAIVKEIQARTAVLEFQGKEIKLKL